jgi:hypothetical protein
VLKSLEDSSRLGAGTDGFVSLGSDSIDYVFLRLSASEASSIFLGASLGCSILAGASCFVTCITVLFSILISSLMSISSLLSSLGDEIFAASDWVSSTEGYLGLSRIELVILTGLLKFLSRGCTYIF